jgi:hypothetical protein
MKLRASLAFLIFAAALTLPACSPKRVANTSTAGAIGANSAAPATRLFDRRYLAVSGFNNLTEFIRPEVRVRLDQEPSGSDENGYVSPPSFTDMPYEAPDSDQQEAFSEENPAKDQELENIKFLWAKKKFGDTLSSDSNASGVIILYADENYYEISRLIFLVEEGRNRIVADSGIDPARIQVVFGGYRGVPQVEFWVVPAGENMPEFKPEERDAPGDSEN